MEEQKESAKDGKPMANTPNSAIDLTQSDEEEDEAYGIAAVTPENSTETAKGLWIRRLGRGKCHELYEQHVHCEAYYKAKNIKVDSSDIEDTKPAARRVEVKQEHDLRNKRKPTEDSMEADDDGEAGSPAKKARVVETTPTIGKAEPVAELQCDSRATKDEADVAQEHILDRATDDGHNREAELVGATTNEEASEGAFRQEAPEETTVSSEHKARVISASPSSSANEEELRGCNEPGEKSSESFPKQLMECVDPAPMKATDDSTCEDSSPLELPLKADAEKNKTAVTESDALSGDRNACMDKNVSPSLGELEPRKMEGTTEPSLPSPKSKEQPVVEERMTSSTGNLVDAAAAAIPPSPKDKEEPKALVKDILTQAAASDASGKELGEGTAAGCEMPQQDSAHVTGNVLNSARDDAISHFDDSAGTSEQVVRTPDVNITIVEQQPEALSLTDPSATGNSSAARLEYVSDCSTDLQNGITPRLEIEATPLTEDLCHATESMQAKPFSVTIVAAAVVIACGFLQVLLSSGHCSCTSRTTFFGR